MKETKLEYPTIEEIEKAGEIQLDEWYRKLPSPGIRHTKDPVNFEKMLKEELDIMDAIFKKLKKHRNKWSLIQ